MMFFHFLFSYFFYTTSFSLSHFAVVPFCRFLEHIIVEADLKHFETDNPLRLKTLQWLPTGLKLHNKKSAPYFCLSEKKIHIKSFLKLLWAPQSFGLISTFPCSCVQMAMMSQTSCQLTLLSGGVASNWSTSCVHLYRYMCFVTYFLHIYPYILFVVFKCFSCSVDCFFSLVLSFSIIFCFTLCLLYVKSKTVF